MRIGITIGDAAGIGPEIVAKAVDAAHAGRLRIYGASGLFDELDCDLVDVLPDVDFTDISPGVPDARCARLQLAALERAIDDAEAGELDAIVTAPWTKSLFETIGHRVTGHTEILAERFEVGAEHVMMLAGDVLRVALVTTHVPIAEVTSLITVQRVVRTLRVTALELRKSWGIDRPRIAVCGLDPHAGESGHIGTTDRDVVVPAIARARAELDATIEGPFPSDTLFTRFRGAEAPFDAVVAMYHDQGLVPLKLRHFGRSANITLGLPVVRTSVDHGTAYDIAGKGVADPSSMRYAINLAHRLVEQRRNDRSH